MFNKYINLCELSAWAPLAISKNIREVCLTGQLNTNGVIEYDSMPILNNFF